MAEFLMPKLSDTMEEGTILQWMKGDGEDVRKGEPLVEIETDKANMVVEAPEDGSLQIVAQEGDTLPVGQVIAAIGGGDGAGARPAAPRREVEAEAADPEEDAEAVVEVPADHDEHDEVADEEERTDIPVADDGTGGSIGMEVGVGETYPGAGEGEREEAPARPAAAGEEAVEQPEEEPAADGGATRDRIKASPLARQLAKRLDVELAAVRGTGPGGRVVRADVERAARAGRAGERPAPTGPAKPAERAPARPAEAPAKAGERRTLTRLQQTVARRMARSKAEAPHFYLERDVDATDAQALRRDLVAAAPEDARPTLNDLVVRAVAMAAAERPDAISRFDGDAVIGPEGVQVGVAVAVERGLLVPVVRDADRKRIGEIAREVRDLASRCRDGTITPPELEGSAITVSNLGMYGIDRFAAIINPPEAAILAVGRARPVPVVRDEQVVVRDLMTLTLSVDHRVLYGAEGATFLARIAELLERPHALVL